MSDPNEVPDHGAGDLGRMDVDEKLKQEVAKGPLDEESGAPHNAEDSHDAVGQTQTESENDLTP